MDGLVSVKHGLSSRHFSHCVMVGDYRGYIKAWVELAAKPGFSSFISTVNMGYQVPLPCGSPLPL